MEEQTSTVVHRELGVRRNSVWKEGGGGGGGHTLAGRKGLRIDGICGMRKPLIRCNHWLREKVGPPWAALLVCLPNHQLIKEVTTDRQHFLSTTTRLDTSLMFFDAIKVTNARQSGSVALLKARYGHAYGAPNGSTHRKTCKPYSSLTMRLLLLGSNVTRNSESLGFSFCCFGSIRSLLRMNDIWYIMSLLWHTTYWH